MRITVRNLSLVCLAAGALTFIIHKIHTDQKEEQIRKLEENIDLLDKSYRMSVISEKNLDSLIQLETMEKPVNSGDIKKLAQENINHYKNIYHIADLTSNEQAIYLIKIQIMEDVKKEYEEMLIFSGISVKTINYILIAFPGLSILVFLYDLIFRKKNYK